MGLLKTAIMSGAAMYGVHELSKGFQNHQANQQQQQYQSHQHYLSGYEGRGRENQERRTQHDYPQAQQPRGLNEMPYVDDSGYGYTATYAPRSDRDDAYDYDRRSPSKVEKSRPRSADPARAGKGSNLEYYDAPPQYNDGAYNPPRQTRGFVEGEVVDERCGAARGSGHEMLEMLGSRLGPREDGKREKKGKSGAEKAASLAGMLMGVPDAGKK